LPLRAAGKTQRIEMQSVRALGASAVPVGSIYACSMALLFVDTIFAKHALTGQEAGYYTAAGLIARIIPFGVNLIVPLIMPKAVAARHTSHAALARLLAVTFSIAAAGVAVALLTMELLPKALVTLTFGGAFLPAASLLRLYAIDTALIALGALGYTYLAAIGEYAVSGWLVAAVIGEAAVMAVWGTSATALLHIAIAGNALVLPVVAFLVWRSLAHAPQALATLVAEALPTASTVPEFPTA
jgi:O-antigen/teichoic acid export membrane protein